MPRRTARMAAVEPVRRQRFQHAPGDIGAGGIEHGVVIRERNVAQEFPVVIGVESRPAAVARLHGEQPVERALRSACCAARIRRRATALSASITMAVSSISGIEFVVSIRRPSRKARYSAASPTNRPCGGSRLLEQPVGRRRQRLRASGRPAPAHRPPIAVSQTGEKQGWKKKRSPSSTIRLLNWRSASTRNGCPSR